MQYIRRFFALAFAASVAAFSSISAAAAENSAGFTAVPVPPENQAAGVSGYYDLMVEPGHSQELTLELHNPGTEEITLTIEAFTATTNRGGSVNYASDGRSDETLRHSLAELMEIPDPYVVVGPGATETATLTLRVPKDPFVGVLLGGIQVTKELTDAEMRQGGAILNQYSYVFAVKLRCDTAAVAPDFQLGDVAAELAGGYAAVVGEIRNVVPDLVRGVDIQASVYPQGSDTAILEQRMPDVELAPNSIMPLTLSDEAGYGIPAGEYRAVYDISYNGQGWHLEKQFVIEPAKADAMNGSAVNQTAPMRAVNASPPLWAILLICICGLLITGAFLFLIINARRDRYYQRQLMELDRMRRETIAELQD